MARFYSNENISFPLVDALRSLGHDVLTSYDAGNANLAVPDAEVLAFAAAEGRILLSYNRLHFVRLHKHRTLDHAGIVICSFDPDYAGQAQRIHDAVASLSDSANQLLRVNRLG